MEELLKQITTMRENGYITEAPLYNLKNEMYRYQALKDYINGRVKIYKQTMLTFNLISTMHLNDIVVRLYDSLTLSIVIAIDALLGSIIECSQAELKLIEKNPLWNVSDEEKFQIEEQVKYYEKQLELITNAVENNERKNTEH